MKRSAVVVGINYDARPPGAPPSVPALRFAEADATALTAELEHDGYAVTSLLGPVATREALVQALDDLTPVPPDLLLVYFAGHGTLDAAGRAYLLPVDVDPAKPRLRGLPLATVACGWQHRRPGIDMRQALAPLSRYIATPATAKHRAFMWFDHQVLPDHQLYVFARADNYFFGILHSCVHELGARATGTQLREAESGFRYTPTTTFETFPFPWPPGQEPLDDPRVEAIAATARELVAKRDAWLNPPDATEADLKQRTLTIAGRRGGGAGQRSRGGRRGERGGTGEPGGQQSARRGLDARIEGGAGRPGEIACIELAAVEQFAHRGAGAPALPDDGARLLYRQGKG